VQKLARKELPSRLVADDMGLGKTLEGLLIDDELRSYRLWEDFPKGEQPPYKRPTLIIAPLATHYDAWVKAIRELRTEDTWSEKALDRNIAVIDSKHRDKLELRLKQKPLPCYVIVHYEALRLMPILKEIKWFHIIADEVHRIKSRTSQQTQAIKKLSCYYKTGLSGTPADDKPQDIWSILNWLYPKQYSSYWRFTNTYCEHQVEQGRGKTFRKIVGIREDRIPQLHREWDAWYIRRKKSEVGIDLPPKYWTELHVSLSPKQRRIYDQMRKDMIAWLGKNEDIPLTAPVVVSQLVRLQQIALATPEFSEDKNGRIHVKLTDPSIKLDRFMELVDGNPNEPLVFFSQSRSMVDLAIQRLHQRRISAVPYTGQVSHRDRDKNIEAFQAGDIQVLAATIASGGEGITLHRASTVVFVDRMWNPSKNTQAEDRLHRIGQLDTVQVIDIMARDTVDLGRKQRIQGKAKDLIMLLEGKSA
jgi:SNF2 family DNA or RNA helicase